MKSARSTRFAGSALNAGCDPHTLARPGSPLFPRPTSSLVAAVTLMALGLVVAGCGKHDAPVAAVVELPTAKVQVVAARIQSLPTPTEISGTVRPLQRAVVAAKLMGTIEELTVTLGQSVRAGDVLAKIAAGEISARVVQAQSQLNQARRDLDRERDLLGKGASTADMVRGLEDRLAMTEAMVREAEVMMGYATLRAPFDGVVARKLANAGDLAAPGSPLLEIEGRDAFEVEAGLPDSLSAGLSPGTRLSVTIPVGNISFEGTIAQLSSAADSSARTVLAKITVPPGTAVRSGQFARVHVPGVPVKTLLVPASVVSRFGQLERIFVVGPDNRAQLRLVKTGAARGELVEILSGLDDGERVIAGAPAGLIEGQPLEIENKAAVSSAPVSSAAGVRTATRQP